MPKLNPGSLIPEVGSNLAFLKGWSADNEETFVEVMNHLKEEQPHRWAELFLRVQDKIAPPKETKTKVSISVDNDHAKLEALAGTIDAARRIEKDGNKTEFTNYEELK